MALPSPVNPVTSYPGGNQFVDVAAAATTVAKNAPGVLARIVVNKAIGSGTITIYDGAAATGTKIGTVTFPATLLANHLVLEYGVACSTNITVVSVQDIDFTIVYW